MKYILLLVALIVLAAFADAGVTVQCGKVVNIGGTVQCQAVSSGGQISSYTATVVKGKWRKRRGGLRGKLGGHRVKDALVGQPAGTLKVTRQSNGGKKKTISVTVNAKGEMKDFWGTIRVTVKDTKNDSYSTLIEVGSTCTARACTSSISDDPWEKYGLMDKRRLPTTCGYQCRRNECCERKPDTCSSSTCSAANALLTAADAQWRSKHLRSGFQCVDKFRCHATDCCEKRATCNADMCRYDSSLQLRSPAPTCHSFSRCDYSECCEQKKKPKDRCSRTTMHCPRGWKMSSLKSQKICSTEKCAFTECCAAEAPTTPAVPTRMRCNAYKPWVNGKCPDGEELSAFRASKLCRTARCTPKECCMKISPTTPTTVQPGSLQPSYTSWGDCIGGEQLRKVDFCFTIDANRSITGGADVAACTDVFQDRLSRSCIDTMSTGDCTVVKTIGDSAELKVNGSCEPQKHCLQSGRTFRPRFCMDRSHGANVCCFAAIPGF